MIVKKKLYELWCSDYSKIFKKDWEFNCISNDSFITGFKKTRDFIFNKLKENNIDYTFVEDALNQETDYEYKNGDHQSHTGHNLKNCYNPERFREFLKIAYECQDIRIHEKDGVVSFQGTFNLHD